MSEEESRHCVKVLRHVAGDVVNVIDGRGGLYSAKIVEAHQKRVMLEVLSVEENYCELPYRLHLAMAPTKNIDRFEWFVEKATEIGVHSVTPLLCRYSERKVLKPERIEKILLSATKQSLKAYLPVLNPMIDVKKFLEDVDVSQKFIAHCYDGYEKEHLLRCCASGGDVLLMVGPEGDFSREEVDLALASGFQSVSLGDSRLRTETAGVVGCEIVSLVNL